MQQVSEEAVHNALALIRPILQADDGDIKLVEITPDAVVKVQLLGRCSDCPKSDQTLKNVVMKTILKTVPGVRRVEAVS